jgi:hypothetical protein
MEVGGFCRVHKRTPLTVSLHDHTILTIVFSITVIYYVFQAFFFLHVSK